MMSAGLLRSPCLGFFPIFFGFFFLSQPVPGAESFQGQFFRGEGDTEYLQLLDISRRMFAADPEFQSFGMLYAPAWNGFVEGPTWGAWWIQNSYGPTFCALPLFEEPLTTFLQNAQDLWFDQMGDGKRKGANNWVAPDGCLCDAASPGWIYYKQGDGRVDIHDWGMEFTAAGLVMQAELLLISRDPKAIRRYLPRLERCAEFIESRRDPKNNLFLAGPAGNLLAPSYAGWKRPNGTYDKAYLAGLSVTYIAGLDRLIELEKLAGKADKVKLFSQYRDQARQGLPLLTTEEGYFIKSLDPDGTRHGILGAAKHGYFEAVVNHDALCFRVVDEPQARRIYARMASLPKLRPQGLIITNYPALDDMYVPGTDWLWGFGTWVNGGHWSTCEARAIMAYYQLGQYEDARRSMRQMMKFARTFRMDNPLVDFGNAVYQPGEPINLCYDSFGPPAALLRGLFEYQYRADGLTLVPHIPPGITRLEQHFPIRLGKKELFLGTVGTGPISAVLVNGQPWRGFDSRSIVLPFEKTPERAVIQIVLGKARPVPFQPFPVAAPGPVLPAAKEQDRILQMFPVIANNRLPLRFGADSSGGSRFLGDLGRARLFGRALSPEEIAILARARGKASSLDKDPCLVGNWDFSHSEGNLIPNVQGKHLPAKMVGTVKTVASREGSGVQFRGQGYLEVAHDPRLDLAACTMEAWIKPGVHPSTGGRIMDKTQVGTSNGYLLDTHPGNSLRLIVDSGSLGHDARLTPDRWVHVAGTVGSDGAKTLYIDGKRVAFQQNRLPVEVAQLKERVVRISRFTDRLKAAGLAHRYETAHGHLAAAYYRAFFARQEGIQAGRIPALPEPSRVAGDRSYLMAAARLCEGLEKQLAAYQTANDGQARRVYDLWKEK